MTSADHVRSGDWWRDIPEQKPPDIRKQCLEWPCDMPPKGCGAAAGDSCTHPIRRKGWDGKPVIIQEPRKMPCLSRLKKVEGPHLL